MRLVRLGLVGFGRFVGRTIDLGPGFNVVFGPNEAGKSTIQKFILGMFYGLKKQGTRRDYTPDHGRFQPWNSDDYRGVLGYQLDDGRIYRVERDFSIRRERVAVYDDTTGEDLTGTFPQDRRKEVLFAEKHLRVGEGVFVSTAWVGQLETSKLAMARELSTRVANLQESGREDLSVREALRLLEDQLKEIGTERAPTRPYARTLRAIEEREAELQRALQAREETLEWEERLAEVQEQLERVSGETSQVSSRYELTRLRETEARLERAHQLGARVSELRPRLEELRPYAGFTGEGRDEVQHLALEVDSLGEQEEQLARRLAALGEEKESLEAEVERFQRLQGLSPAAVSDLSTAVALLRAGERQVELVTQEFNRLSDSARKLEETLGPLQGIAEKGADVTARTEAIEKEIAQIQMRSSVAYNYQDEPEPEPKAQRRPTAAAGSGPAGALLVVLLGVVLAGAGLMYQLKIILPKLLPGLDWTIPAALEASGALLLIVGVLSALRRGRQPEEAVVPPPMMPRRGAPADEADDLAWRQRLRELEMERERLLTDVRASSAADLKTRLIRWEQFAARREQSQARLQTLAAELEQRQADVVEQRETAAGILALWQGVAPEAVRLDEQAVSDFRQAWQRWSEVRSRYTSVAHDFAETAERHRGISERLARSSQELEEYLRRAGVEDVAQYLQACRAREQFQAMRAEYEAVSQGLEQALRGERYEAVERQLAVLRQRWAEVAAGSQGQRVDLPEGLSSAMLQEELRVLEHRRAELQQLAADLSARLETTRRDVADLADLQRELESLREDLAGMDRELQALELARDTIDIVSGDIHREFAPLLNQTIGSILANVTGGRYNTIKVDENLGLRALSDERLVEVWDLSSGTVDQFYFALRLALVDLITAGSERLPLLLDDPFVQYDDDRLRGALTYLQHLTRGGSQIVLFTCHRRDVEVARALGSRVVDLTGM